MVLYMVNTGHEYFNLFSKTFREKDFIMLFLDEELRLKFSKLPKITHLTLKLHRLLTSIIYAAYSSTILAVAFIDFF